MSLTDFVRLTATEPAKLYNPCIRRRARSPFAATPTVIWDPEATTTITHDTTHDRSGYSAYVGRDRAGPAMCCAAGR
ncbi:MAG: hypothetical protein R3D28_00460 [Geminicoccaceae bacterium]